MEDDADDLDLLTALMDDDEAFEEESCAVLEESTPPSSDDNPDQSSPSAKKHDVSIDEMSERMSQMQDYIKLLESQLAQKDGTSGSITPQKDVDKSSETAGPSGINAGSREETRQDIGQSTQKGTRNVPTSSGGSNSERSSPSNLPSRTQGIPRTKRLEHPHSSAELNKENAFPPITRRDSPSPARKQSSSSERSTAAGETSGSRRVTDPKMSMSSKDTRVAHKPTSSSANNRVPSADAGDSRKRKADGNLGSISQKPTHGDANMMFDKFSGFRIINPLISSTVMEMRMEGRKFVKASQILQKIKGNDIEGDWVTIAVLAQKLPAKKSSNGKTYGLWKLTDLGSTTANDLVALFLFDNVYKEHWKTAEGTVIALLNSNILPAKDKNNQDVALTLDNPKKLMVMGVSKDFGRCKGIKKKDGNPCSNIVNREYGDFCEYHVQTAYKKMRSQRMECQSGYGAPSKAPLMEKFKKDLNSATFMYQGKTLLTQPTPALKKNNVTLKSFQGTKASKNALDAARKEIRAKREQEKSSEHMLELMALPTVGTRNLVKHLEEDEEKAKPKEERISISASELLKVHSKALQKARRRATATANSTSVSEPDDEDKINDHKPTLGRGFAPGSDIVLDGGSTQRSKKGLDKAALAKLRAIAIVRQKGPIEKEDPNATTKKVSPKTRAGHQGTAENVTDDESPGNQPKSKRRKLLGDEFDSIDFNSKEGRKLLKKKSAHVGAVRAAEAEMEQRYFNELEKKERLEDKLQSVKELKVKVVSCSKCNYVAEGASDLCRKENHKLKYTTAMKKFFVCKDCKERTVTYGGPVPTHPCRKCGSRNYEKSSLYKEKKGPKLVGETLLVRGEEHPKFLNSLK